MTDARARLEAAVVALRLDLPSGALDLLERHAHEVLRWRSRLNLISEGSAAAVVDRHLIDSLLPLTALEIPRGSRIVDVGSGAGFPGVPLRIARPDLAVTLVEASRRRVAFLEHLRAALGLADVTIEWGRAEALGHRDGLRERFDVATERAAAKVSAAAELCLPFVVVGGLAILLKGPTAVEEIGPAAPLVAVLGGTFDRLHRCVPPGTERSRVLVVIRKAGPTPEGYPRRAGRLGRPA